MDPTDPRYAPAVPVDGSGLYIVRNNQTLSVSREWLNVTRTTITMEREVMEFALFYALFTPIEKIDEPKLELDDQELE